MNVGLDVRVLDQMGLAYPLAAHTERLDDGRIGHDKALYPDWVVVGHRNGRQATRGCPWYLDEDWVTEARGRAHVPGDAGTADVVPVGADLGALVQNFKRSLEFAEFRFDRVPQYEIEQCGLEPPELDRPH